MGKTPALCAAGSAFRRYYDGCGACIASNGRLDAKAYLANKFSDFLNYCDSPRQAVSTVEKLRETPVPPAPGPSPQPAPVTSQDSIPMSPSSSIAKQPPESQRPSPDSTIMTSGILLTTPVTSGLASHAQDINGQSSKTIMTQTLNISRSDWTGLNTPSPSSIPSQSSDASLPSPDNTTRFIWPAVGGVVGFVLLLIIGLFLYVRHRRTPGRGQDRSSLNAGSKAQLHADSAFYYEKDAREQYEMPGSNASSQQHYEMPGSNVFSQELPVNRLGERRRSL